MNTQAGKIILYGTLVIVGLYFFFHVLIKGQVFFVPLTFAILLSMLVVPICSRLEHKGISRGWASFMSVLVLIAFTGLLFWLVGMQIKNIQQDWPKMKKELSKTAGKIDSKLEEYSWLPGGQLNLEQKIKSTSSKGGKRNEKASSANKEKSISSAGQQQGNAQQDSTAQQKSKGGEKHQQGPASQKSSGGLSNGMFQQVWHVLKSMFGFIGTMLLVFIYVFFFLLYRKKFHKSLLHFIRVDKKDEVEEMVNGSSHVAQQYLLGRLILMIFLAVLYTIGFMAAGIKYAIFIALIASFLSIIPYLGNLIGLVFAAVMAMVSGGGGGALVGVGITFFIAQFIESYVLEPFVVGHKVDLNPVITIVVVVFGDFIWGVPGMIVAIPMLAIFKVVCDHVPPLNPIGYTLGEEGLDQGSGVFKKIEGWIQKKTKKSEP